MQKKKKKKKKVEARIFWVYFLNNKKKPSIIIFMVIEKKLYALQGSKLLKLAVKKLSTLTNTLFFPITLTTSPTYEPGSWSSCNSSLSILTGQFK